ncbi:MAG: flagellar hook-length control protein FliK [Fimbriimonadaceae bacterium]|nr:flagellar hook-length control protein FliK [Fimbriimonadaceae bacterium]QYK55302.1 MAG: flagellar hook-length control protein FliK [Fimbriimonadaceae bacterium]
MDILAATVPSRTAAEWKANQALPRPSAGTSADPAPSATPRAAAEQAPQNLYDLMVLSQSKTQALGDDALAIDLQDPEVKAALKAVTLPPNPAALQASLVQIGLWTPSPKAEGPTPVPNAQSLRAAIEQLPISAAQRETLASSLPLPHADARASEVIDLGRRVVVPKPKANGDLPYPTPKPSANGVTEVPNPKPGPTPDNVANPNPGPNPGTDPDSVPDPSANGRRHEPLPGQGPLPLPHADQELDGDLVRALRPQIVASKTGSNSPAPKAETSPTPQPHAIHVVENPGAPPVDLPKTTAGTVRTEDPEQPVTHATSNQNATDSAPSPNARTERRQSGGDPMPRVETPKTKAGQTPAPNAGSTEPVKPKDVPAPATKPVGFSAAPVKEVGIGKLDEPQPKAQPATPVAVAKQEELGELTQGSKPAPNAKELEADETAPRATAAQPKASAVHQAPSDTAPHVTVTPKAAAQSAKPSPSATNTLSASQASSVLRQLADRVQTLITARQAGEVVVRLDPADLGSITLSVTSLGNRVDAEVKATHEGVRQALQAGRTELFQQIENRGMTLNSFNVGADQGQAGGQAANYMGAHAEAVRSAQLAAAFTGPRQAETPELTPRDPFTTNALDLAA